MYPKIKHLTLGILLYSTIILACTCVDAFIGPVNSYQPYYSTKIINPDNYPGDDDFEKLKNAFSDVPPEGATIIIPPKVYEGSNLYVPSNVKIVGMKGATFKLLSNAIYPFLVIRAKENVTIENIIFDGNKENISGLNTPLVLIDHGSSNISLFNNTFQNFRNIAIASNYSKTDLETSLIKIRNNYFINGEGAAVLLRGYYEKGKFFLKFVDVRQNILQNLYLNGKIGVAFASEVNISENIICCSEAAFSGNIVIRGCENVIISNNMIVYCKAIAGILIETSLIFPNKGVFVIERNQVSNERGRGFYITGEEGVNATVYLRKNVFANNSGPDVELPNIKCYVYGNTVDTPNDLILSSLTVALGNHFTLAENAWLFIIFHAR